MDSERIGIFCAALVALGLLASISYCGDRAFARGHERYMACIGMGGTMQNGVCIQFKIAGVHIHPAQRPGRVEVRL